MFEQCFRPPPAAGGLPGRRRDRRAPPWLPSHPPQVAAWPAACGVAAATPPWLLRQLLLPLAAFAVANLLLLPLGGDLWIADHVYQWEGGRWALKDGFITAGLVHEAGKRASALAWLGVVAAAIAASLRPQWRPWCQPLRALALSILVATAGVAWLKSWTDVDCPWDLLAYGGHRGYHALFAAAPAGAPVGRCFPAGHASAGYAWVSLYFFFAATRPGLRWAGLAAGLGAGALFGISQQLRGAHFMSHDAWTLMICWLVALAVHRAFLARAQGSGRAAVAAPPVACGA